jgi:hypothetical protein
MGNSPGNAEGNKMPAEAGLVISSGRPRDRLFCRLINRKSRRPVTTFWENNFGAVAADLR